jgi:hypothetical protein
MFCFSVDGAFWGPYLPDAVFRNAPPQAGTDGSRFKEYEMSWDEMVAFERAMELSPRQPDMYGDRDPMEQDDDLEELEDEDDEFEDEEEEEDDYEEEDDDLDYAEEDDDEDDDDDR